MWGEEVAILLALKMENEAMKPRNAERVKKLKKKERKKIDYFLEL